MKLYGLVTKDGTTASETVLCRRHLGKQFKRTVSAQLSDDIPSTQYHDVSGNDAIECGVCGAKGA